MTAHVVCLDGTGQIRSQPNPTNIALIFNAMGGTIVDGGYGSFESSISVAGREVQTGKYLPGVGTQGPRLLNRLEQSVGAGIAEQIVRGYTFLSRSYQAGDEIIVVGFSRGAAAARCLAGFVVGQGLLNPNNYDTQDKEAAYVRAIGAWYQYRQGQPHLARAANLMNIAGDLSRPVPSLAATDFVEVERIRAVAVFDTVSSMGVPRIEPDGWIGYDFVLADTVLNSKVLNGFHALSADEDRANFFPTFWTPRINVTQVIFPGNHSDVGGGYAETALSDRALQWMLSKLGGQGLRYELANIRPLVADANGAGHDDSTNWPWNLLPRAPRIFPIDAFEGEQSFLTDGSLRARWGETVTLLPGTNSKEYSAVGLFFGPKPLFAKAGSADRTIA